MSHLAWMGFGFIAGGVVAYVIVMAYIIYIGLHGMGGSR